MLATHVLICGRRGGRPPRRPGHPWPSISKLLFVPPTEIEYNRLVQILDALIDVVGEEGTHPLASLMEVIGVSSEEYENRYVPKITDA